MAIVMLTGFALGVIATICVFLIRLPIVELPMSQYVRHKTEIARRALAAEFSEDRELDDVGTVGHYEEDDKGKKHWVVETPAS